MHQARVAQVVQACSMNVSQQQKIQPADQPRQSAVLHVSLHVSRKSNTIIVKDLGSCLEPDRFLETNAELVAEELREDTSKGAQHGPPVMSYV